MWEATGLPYPALLDRLIALASSVTPRSSGCAPASPDAMPRLGGDRARAAARGCAARRPRSTRGLTAAPLVGARLRRHLRRRFDEVPQLLAAACAPARPGRARRQGPAPKPAAARRGGALVADPARPARPVARPGVRGAGRRGASPPPKRGRPATRRGPRPGSTWAAATAPARSGAACAASGWPRRATASASRRRSSARWRSIRRCRTPASASASTTTTPTWRPSAAKVLRWLLLLPGGDRVAGLQEMKQARTRRAAAAERSRLPAAPRLSLVREGRPSAPSTLARELRERHPHNPHFVEVEADIQDVHRSDPARQPAGLAAAWPTPRRPAAWRWPDAAAARARLGMAAQLDRLFETDLAIDQLRTLLASPPPHRSAPRRGRMWRWAQALDRMGVRDEAVAQYKLALAAVPPATRSHGRAGARRAAPQPRRHDRAGLSAVARRLAGARARRARRAVASPRPRARAAARRSASPATVRRACCSRRTARARGHRALSRP